MEIKEAQKMTEELIETYGGYWKPLSMFARITEELGELGRAMNIKHGDKKSKNENDGREIEEELSDVMITAMMIAGMEGINLDEAIKNKLEKDWEKCKKVYKE